MTTTPNPENQPQDPNAHHSSTPTPEHLDGPLRPHSYDGIQEYDKRLPRWWLLTLYGAMVFAVLYWGYYETYHIGMKPSTAVEIEMAENAERAARQSGVIDDGILWKMSREPQTVSAGKATFETTCAACHKPDLSGLIGPNLVDQEWIHGGNPMEVMKTITEGVAAKGMPTWGPLLGKQKITELVAFIFSHHQQGEKIIIVPGWVPPGGIAPPPATTVAPAAILTPVAKP